MEGSSDGFNDVMAGERISHRNETVSDLMANVGAATVSRPACGGTEATDDADLTIVEQRIVGLEMFDDFFGRHVVFQKIHRYGAKGRIDEGLIGECSDVVLHMRTVGTNGQGVGSYSHAEPSCLLASAADRECHGELAPDRGWVVAMMRLQHGEKSANRKALVAR